MARGKKRSRAKASAAPARQATGAPDESLHVSLEREIGRPADEWREDDIVDFVRDRGIRVVSLMHVGGEGQPKVLDFVPHSLSHLRDILAGGERADGSSLFGGLGIRVHASDIMLGPRLSTAFVDPFSPVPTLAILCGHLGADGRPLPESPDTVVRLGDERLKREAGVSLHALGEVEFFLGKTGAPGDGVEEHGYHATSPLVFGEGLRREALVHLADMRVPIKYAHSEVGHVAAVGSEETVWEQHEIELGLAPLPQAADAIVLTRWVLGNLARRHSLRISFEPVVRAGHASNGLHFHFSPVVNGRHCGGHGSDGRLEPPAEWLIAGLVQTGAALMAFGNRGETSLLRLGQRRETPVAVFWGQHDRTALVRLPLLAGTRDGRRTSPPTVEFRLPDSSAHAHLVLAGVAQAMLGGRRCADRAALLARTEASGAGQSPTGAAPLPRTLGEIEEAVDAWRGVLEEGSVFPPALIDRAKIRLRRAADTATTDI